MASLPLQRMPKVIMILILLLASLVNCSGNSTHCPPSRPGEHFLGSGWWLEISPLITMPCWWQETLFWKIPPSPTFLDLERLLFFVRSGSKRSPHQGQQCLSTHNDVSPNVPLDLTLLYRPLRENVWKRSSFEFFNFQCSNAGQECP